MLASHPDTMLDSILENQVPPDHREYLAKGCRRYPAEPRRVGRVDRSVKENGTLTTSLCLKAAICLTVRQRVPLAERPAWVVAVPDLLRRLRYGRLRLAGQFAGDHDGNPGKDISYSVDRPYRSQGAGTWSQALEKMGCA
jgi:hypothetical protein